MKYGKIVIDNYICAIVAGDGGTPISEAEYNIILNKINEKPLAPDGYCYRLTENLEWVLEHLPPVTFSEDEALVRFSNELTGQQDETLEEATETLIKIVKEEM